MRVIGRGVAGVLSAVILLALAVFAARNSATARVALVGGSRSVSLGLLALACGALGLALGALLIGPGRLLVGQRARLLDRELTALRAKIADLERDHTILSSERDNAQAECDLLRMRVAQLVRYAGANFDYDAPAPIPASGMFSEE